MGSERFCLKWNDFDTNISVALRELRDDKDFFDVTLACDDDQIQAHKVILSACSPFFKNVLRRNPHQHPLLYLKGFKYTDLQSVLNFMYNGEVSIAQEELNSFLAVAEDLKVKGLTQSQSSSSSSHAKDSFSASKTQETPYASKPVPVPKRSHLTSPSPSYTSAQDDDEIQEEVSSVKAEPREHFLNPNANLTPVYVYHAPCPDVQQQVAPPQPSHVMALSQQTQQLEQIDTSLRYAVGDSYDDVGQYKAEVGYDGGIVDQEMEAQDGTQELDLSGLTLEEACEKGLRKVGPGNIVCLVCGTSSRDIRGAKNHLEAKHFLTQGYPCEFCNTVSKTKHGLACHISRNHRVPK